MLHLITDLQRGGAERQLLTLLSDLDRQRFSAAVAFLKGTAHLAPSFEAAGVPVYELSRAGLAGPVALVSLARLLRGHRHHIIHTHLIEADVYGAIAARLARTPVLISSRHNDDAFLRNPLVAFVQRQAARQARNVVVISEALRRFVLQQRTVDRPEKVVRIPYGLDPLPFDTKGDEAALRAELGVGPSDVLIGCVARLTAQKGQRYLLEAFPEVLRMEPRVRLALFGVGELRTELEKITRRLDLSSRVTFVGFRADNVTIMRALDIVVLPSLWEGFGLVLLEAMAARRPVVATAVSGIPEVVADGRTGLLVPPRNPRALANALVKLASSASMREELGVAGRERLETEFSVDRMVDAMEALYVSSIS